MQKLQEKRPGRVQNGGGRIPILHKKKEQEEYQVYIK
jgi:hypothetical protein